ncbi:MAG: NADH-quinone oxidoreductase subunit C [Candidatus Poseidoniia archaeon]|nr:NADH-quinone oxidoreductase subunit C [Candidatus Poseidoniia archaeon]
METGQFVQQLAKRDGASDGSVLRANVGRITVTRAASQAFFRVLKEDFGFDHCSLISAVDNQTGFELVYHFSIIDMEGQMLEVHVELPRDTPTIDSITHLWGGADWHEREAYDLMGIYFIGHPDLKRVLLPDGFAGHPLRKDYVYEIHEEEW